MPDSESGTAREHELQARKALAIEILKTFHGPEKTFRKRAGEEEGLLIDLHWDATNNRFILDVTQYGDKTTLSLSRDRSSSEKIFDLADSQWINGDIPTFDHLRPMLEAAMAGEGYADYTADEERLLELLGNPRLSPHELEHPADTLITYGILTEADVPS